MSTDAFAALTRTAAETVSRRRSLLRLGGAALVAGPAGRMRAEAKQSPSKKASKKCKRQSGKCRTFFLEVCEENECNEEGLEDALQCCAGFKTCNAGALLDCLFTPSMM